MTFITSISGECWAVDLLSNEAFSSLYLAAPPQYCDQHKEFNNKK